MIELWEAAKRANLSEDELDSLKVTDITDEPLRHSSVLLCFFENHKLTPGMQPFLSTPLVYSSIKSYMVNT